MGCTTPLLIVLLFGIFLQVSSNAPDSVFSRGKAFQDLIRGYAPNQLIVPSYLQGLLDPSTAASKDGKLSRILNGVSGECTDHINHWITSLNNPSENVWALHMIDAWGKLPEGILSGHVSAMGDYDECVGIKVEGKYTFKGKYCTVFLSPNTEGEGTKNENSRSRGLTPQELLELILLREGVLINPSSSLCLPSTCSDEDIQLLLINGFDAYNLTQLIVPLIAEDTCFTDTKPDFDAGDISVMVLLGVIFGLCAIGTVIDVTRDKTSKPSLGLQYLLAFSVYTNTVKFLSTRASGENLGCIHGIRFLSTSWIILAHTWYMVTFIPMWNMPDVKLMYQDWTILTILNATLAVDTFFVISGLLVSYNVLKMLDKSRGKMNIPMFYLHRYLRLTPTYAILIGIMSTLLPYFGSGPFWTIINTWASWCETNWWTNLLYVNNFVGIDKLCQGEAWYLANDFQFYILSPFIIYPLWKKPKLGVAFLTLLTILSCVCPGWLVLHYDTPPTTIPSRGLGTWFADIYIKPYARIQTFLVGIWVGYFLHTTKGKKLVLSKVAVLCCWALAAGVALAVLYGIHPWFEPANEIPDVGNFLYAALNRMAWGTCVAWVIFACVKGHGGWVDTFLSWKAFMPLGRLCFCAYLVSLHIQMIFHLSFRQAVTYQNYTMTNFYFAHMITSFGLGFFCTITFESPFIQIEKLIFGGGGGGGGEKPPQKAATPPKDRNGIFYNKTETIIEAGAEKGD